MITHTIHRPGARIGAPVTVRRTAVRAVIGSSSRILMIYSPVNRDYKFPGGGVEEAETHKAALTREVLEEAGVRTTAIGPKLAEITEFGPPFGSHAGQLMMVSHYYRCEVDMRKSHRQRLDGYEARLEFTPVWISLEEAIGANRTRLAEPDPPRWTARETWFLEHMVGAPAPGW